MKTFDNVVEETHCPRPDGSAMALRIARPGGKGPFPAVIDIHGGGWVSGDRQQNAAIDDFLARAGIVAIAPEFRMPPEVQYPVPISDVLLAIHWLKEHAGDLQSSPDLVGGVGTSSGGHQLLEAVLRPRHAPYASQLKPNADVSLAYVVACWPVADALRRLKFARERNNAQLLKAHELYWPTESDMEAGSPQKVLELGLEETLPPLLVIQGSADDNLPSDSAERLVAAWRQRHGEASLEKFEGQPHAFVTRNPQAAASQSALTSMASFILRSSAALR